MRTAGYVTLAGLLVWATPGFAAAPAFAGAGSAAGVCQEDARKAASPVQAPAGTMPASLAGRWELNAQQSDKPPDAVAEPGEGGQAPPGQGGTRGGRGGGMRGGIGGGMGGPGGGRPPGSEASATEREETARLLEASRTLVIAQDAVQVNVTDDIGHTVSLKPDGVKVKEQRYGRTNERKSWWDGRTLVTELKLANGTKTTSTFTKVNEGLQLVVTTKVERKRMQPLELKRVYDQAFEGA